MSDSGNSTCGSECDSACEGGMEPMLMPFTVQVTPKEAFEFSDADMGMRIDSLTLLKGTDCVVYQDDKQYGKICLGRLVHPYCVNLLVNMEEFYPEMKIICEGDDECAVAVTGSLQEPEDDGDDSENMSDGESSVDEDVKIEEVPTLVDESAKTSASKKSHVAETKAEVEVDSEESHDSEESDGDDEDEPMVEEPKKEEEAPVSKKSAAEKKKDLAVQKRPAKKEQPASPKKPVAAASKSGSPNASTASEKEASSPENKSESAAAPKSETSEVKTGVRRQLGRGLAYEILEVGKGNMAVSGKQANVKYVLTLAKTGQKMDSGVIKFRIGGGEVVQGFEKGVKGMCAMERRRIFVPAELGYGKKKTGKIPANSDLIFEVTLLGVKN